jgi:hypothetical protein
MMRGVPIAVPSEAPTRLRVNSSEATPRQNSAGSLPSHAKVAGAWHRSVRSARRWSLHSCEVEDVHLAVREDDNLADHGVNQRVDGRD